ncbi:MAG: type IV pilus assembly protein PilM [Fimbriimonadaceae bacterium]
MSLNPFKKSTILGVDIGHKNFKVVQVERSGDIWKVVRAGRIATPADTVKDGVVVDVKAAGEALKQLMREARISGGRAVIAVAGASVIVRTVRIPKMAEATLRKSIKYEAGRYVPSSVEDSFIEFEILSEAPDEQMDVMIVAAPKEIVQSRMEACQVAGLDTEIVDIEAFASYRALVEADGDPSNLQETIALIDIGENSTSVSVVTNGEFAMARSIPHAGRTLTEALVSYFQLEQQDAEEGKAQLDLNVLVNKEKDKPIENPPLRVIQPHIDELIREVRRSLNYYQSQTSERGEPLPVKRLVVSGGSALMPGLPQYVGHKLGMEVVSRGVFDNPRFVQIGDAAEGSGMDLSVASGLAMRGFAKAA